MNAAIKNKININTRNIDAQILITTEGVATAAKVHGVTLIPYRNETRILSTLTFHQKTQILSHLQTFLSYIPQVATEPLHDEVSMLKMAFKVFQIEAYDDIYSKIEKGDIVEIHTMEGNQIYRNLEMFKVCSFSLLELISYPWTDLYLRSQKVVDCMLTQSIEVMTNPSLGTVLCRYPHHIVTEKAENPYTILLHFKYIAPLKSIETGKPMGVLTTKTGRIMSQGLESDKFRYI